MTGPDVADPAAAAVPETPYVGLVPYAAEDADFFFGRDHESRIVAGNLRASRLTILYGPSGVGKTSLLQAGVVHSLRQRARRGGPTQLYGEAGETIERRPLAVCTFRSWRDDPLPGLVDALRAAVVDAAGPEGLPAWQRGAPVVEAVRAWTTRVQAILVILDQFEEYFLYHANESGTGTLFEGFPALVNEPNLRVNFLLSIREDAWAKLDRFEARIPHLFANYIRVDHLSRAAGRAAIEGPVREWNRRLSPAEPSYTVEAALVDAVLNASASAGSAGDDGASPGRAVAGGEAVEAPFLQLVMERMWRETVASGSRDLTLTTLDRLGGAAQIVENHLLESVRRLMPARTLSATSCVEANDTSPWWAR